MKTIGLILLGALIIMMISTTLGRMNRSMEIKSVLSAAVESTVEQLKLKKTYDIANTNEFIADFTQGLACSIDSITSIKIEITNINKEKGLLSVRVTGTFTHPNGNEGKVVDEKTIILNQVQEDEPETYTVRYYIAQNDTTVYKEYTVLEGDYLTVPAAPNRDGLSFAGWASSAGYNISEPISCNMEFYGLWN